MEDYLFFLHHGFGFRIHGFVLMSNHFHLLISAPCGNLSEGLLYFMRETSKQITRKSGRINQTYGARNHKTLIGSYHYYLNTYKYLFQNPLRAGVCDRVEDYPFSSLSGVCGLQKARIPICDDLLIDQTIDLNTLGWLNTRAAAEHERQMKLALSRPRFEFKIGPKEKPSILESILI